MIYNSDSDCHLAVIFSDAILHALENDALQNLKTLMRNKYVRKQFTLQRVSYHFGVHENERAHRFAKGGECKQTDNEVSYFEKKGRNPSH